MKSQAKKSYAVFGLGRYGLAVATGLAEAGADVLAVDESEALVNAANHLPLCKCADVTDPEVIEQLGIADMDVVIVAMASHLESAVMAVTLCKEAGVPTVIAKCANEMHSKILSRVGADKVIIPESESGTRMAKNLLSSGFIDMMELSDGVSVIELDPREEWIGKTLLELKLRKKYGINVIALRDEEGLTVNVSPDVPLGASTRLIVIARTARLSKLT